MSTSENHESPEIKKKPSEIMTLSELSDYLRLSESTVHRLIERGEIGGYKFGNQWRFKRQYIDEKLDSAINGTDGLPLDLVTEFVGDHQDQGRFQPNEVIEKELYAALNKLIKGINRISDKMNIDGIFIELERPIANWSGGRGSLPRIRLKSGDLVNSFDENDDYYSSLERYPFYTWGRQYPLCVRFFGQDYEKESIEKFRPNMGMYEIGVRAGKLIELLKSNNSIYEKVNMLYNNKEDIIKGEFSSESTYRSALAVLLTSTMYSLKLMDPAITIDKQSINSFNLPHTDQRCSFYIPVFASGAIIGGAVVMSHKNIPMRYRSLLFLSCQLMLSKVRNRDDLIVQKILKEKEAKWYVTNFFIRRMNHDVVKPISQASRTLKNLINSRSDSEERAFLSNLYKNLNLAIEIVKTGTSGTKEELRLASRKTQNKYRLVEFMKDIHYGWKREAFKKNIKLELEINNTEETIVSMPAFTVEEIINNLISNALKFAKKSITISAKVKNDQIIIDIKDDGPGINHTSPIDSETLRNKIAVTPAGTDESGVGLYISKYLANEILDGDIKSIPVKKGAHLCFNFPLCIE